AGAPRSDERIRPARREGNRAQPRGRYQGPRAADRATLMATTPHSPIAADKPQVKFGAQQLAIAIVVVAAIAVSAKLWGWTAPVLLAAAVAAAIPGKHGWEVRLPIALITGGIALFVVKNWPGAEVAAAEAPAAESPTILSWILGLPLAGAVAILFLPRQAPRLLQNVTLVIMLGTLA